MRHIMAALWMGSMIAGSEAHAQTHPVVVELYTSQGCSSCPPADALMEDLVKRDDVIPLALHVDYWDYIGWKDIFGNPAFTKRQRGYARAAGHRMIYTPQMIVDGQDHVVGNKPMQLADLVMKHKALPVSVTLDLERQGDRLTVLGTADAAFQGEVVVQLVRYLPQQTVEITRGENAGKTITYYNVVTEWQVIGTWDPATPLAMQADISGDLPVVVILQEPGHHAIVAAARLR